MSATFSDPLAYSDLLFGDALSVLPSPTFSLPLSYTTPSGTGSTGTLAQSPPTIFEGEALIRETIRQIAVRTTEFDDCWVGGQLDWATRPAAVTGFGVQSVSTKEVTGYDSAPAWTRIFCSHMLLGIYVNNTNSEIRDATATSLLDIIRRKIDGQSLAGITVPNRTKVTDWSWRGDMGQQNAVSATSKPAVAPPVRELQANFICEWIDTGP